MLNGLFIQTKKLTWRITMNKRKHLTWLIALFAVAVFFSYASALEITNSGDEPNLEFTSSPNVAFYTETTDNSYILTSFNNATSSGTDGIEYGMTNNLPGYYQKGETTAVSDSTPSFNSTSWTYMGGE